jgi:hypothetical protein
MVESGPTGRPLFAGPQATQGELALGQELLRRARKAENLERLLGGPGGPEGGIGGEHRRLALSPRWRGRGPCPSFSQHPPAPPPMRLTGSEGAARGG